MFGVLTIIIIIIILRIILFAIRESTKFYSTYDAS